MKALFEHIVPTSTLSWQAFVRREPRFQFQWHFHREFELTLITRGTGRRLVGDSVLDYRPGDLTLIGADMPHTFVSAAGDDDQEAVVIQFRGDFLGAGFLDRPEFASIGELLDRASRGLSFRSQTLDLAALSGGRPAGRTVELLSLLVRLSESEDGAALAGVAPAPSSNRAASGQIDAMVRLMHEAYDRPLGLEEIAAAAHLAPTSASRYFRRTTGMTVTDYLTMLRVSAACLRLRDTDRGIAEIAADCGFANLSNFNRRFRAVKAMAPREYREQFRAMP